ncbi:MAG TPA: glycine cleavage system protein GcvH [Proteiniclasticum sp.]|jgi:glycine cleavage system H protein|uniref:Glycine cleavage system H protein n=1 Tax=Proteiniclasticum ruminis TaxID=398199 RepID=A0A1I4YMR1_9CLOT|nr:MULTISPECIES: glycine cleavage system protein GcvH [Proteiniclasticum]SFN39267.1 glycine cleavage system H protein [Proteiniclasticum ruminis]HBW12929.1 glycine cleavage system protein GcvH [Proteiniclasticum sp.]
MSLVMEGLFYTKDHEWVRVEGEKAYIGITDYAQHSLGSIVYVELPSVGDEISKDDNLGVVESVKAASDIIMPVSGEVLEINEDLEDNPELVNEAPYDNHLVIVKLTDADEIEELLSKEDYEAFISEEE